jgi:hypothetical protein
MLSIKFSKSPNPSIQTAILKSVPFNPPKSIFRLESKVNCPEQETSPSSPHTPGVDGLSSAVFISF